MNLRGTYDGDQASSTSLAVIVGSGVPTPGETSGPTLDPLLVTGYDGFSGEISITYATACETQDNNIYIGSLDEVSTLNWSGGWCSIGTSGSYSFNPGTGSFFFVVVGTKGLEEGSYGRNLLPGGSQNERSPYPGSLCGQIQNLAVRCD